MQTAFELELGSVTVAEAVGVLTSLSALVGGVDVAACGSDDLRSLTGGARAGQQAIETLLMRIGVAADRRATAGDGSGSDAHQTLLGDGHRVRGSTARREAARSRTAAAMSRVGAAVDRGEIGGEQVDAITRAARDRTPEQQQELNSDALLDSARSDPADVFAAKVRREAERIKGDHGLADTKKKQAASRWRHWFDERSGMGKIHAEFDPERYESIVNAVEAHVRLANEGGSAKTPNLAASAAFELLTGVAGQGSGRPSIDVVVDWQAIRSVYRTCAWNRCDRPLAWCQVHHIHEWEHGGMTDLCNLVPLCGSHHHAVHEGGWSIKLAEDRRLDIYRPDGTHWSTARPDRLRSGPQPEDPVRAAGP